MIYDERWLSKYYALKIYIQKRGHLPDKHVVENRALLSWAKYQRKKIKEGSLGEEKTMLFEELMNCRSNEHTGGRKKKTTDTSAMDDKQFLKLDFTE